MPRIFLEGQTSYSGGTGSLCLFTAVIGISTPVVRLGGCQPEIVHSGGQNSLAIAHVTGAFSGISFVGDGEY